MTILAGLDSGSTTSKIVLIEDGQLVDWEVIPTSHDPVAAMERLTKGRRFDELVTTGYGRDLIECHRPCRSVSEVRALARGIRHLRPELRSLVDIGGQDSKVIRLHPDGRILKFEMNDRCAAGTGRFLDMAARLLGMDLYEFSKAAMEARSAIPIASMCAVFAESELITRRSQGADRASLARGVHEAVGERIAAMVARVGAESPLAFTGGCAQGHGLVEVLRRRCGLHEIFVPPEPLGVGALGAALLAGREAI